jgi:hypothetical protein
MNAIIAVAVTASQLAERQAKQKPRPRETPLSTRPR